MNIQDVKDFFALPAVKEQLSGMTEPEIKQDISDPNFPKASIVANEATAGIIYDMLTERYGLTLPPDRKTITDSQTTITLLSNDIVGLKSIVEENMKASTEENRENPVSCSKN